MPTTYAIPDGRTVMAATLWTGDGTTARSISNAVNGVSFQPDLIWIKCRSAADSHNWFDSVRGSASNYKTIQSNTSGAEITPGIVMLSAINSGGYSIGPNGGTNNNGDTFVGWSWKAGGTAVSNTAGSITSTVSANTTAGFSVVTYTHNGTNAATVGHGLGVTPSFIINKQRSAAANWRCYHVSLSAGYNIQLNLTQAQSVAGDIFQTAPTSSVFTPGNGDSASGQTMVAYCFAAVAGYSAFGSYTGNGSADGPFVYTGFRPRWIMVKRVTTAGNSWFILDTARNSYNTANTALFANDSSGDGAITALNILSNGFQVVTSGAGFNTSSDSYIYMAFAETAFKFSNAR